MSKIKNISRTGWLVAGIIVALLLGPTTAFAVTTATVALGLALSRGGRSTAERRAKTVNNARGAA